MTLAWVGFVVGISVSLAVLVLIPCITASFPLLSLSFFLLFLFFSLSFFSLFFSFLFFFSFFPLFAPPPLGGEPGLLIERYLHIPGYDVGAFARPPRYPNHPDQRFRNPGTNFTSAIDVGEYFGMVLRSVQMTPKGSGTGEKASLLRYCRAVECASPCFHCSPRTA